MHLSDQLRPGDQLRRLRRHVLLFGLVRFSPAQLSVCILLRCYLRLSNKMSTNAELTGSSLSCASCDTIGGECMDGTGGEGCVCHSGLNLVLFFSAFVFDWPLVCSAAWRSIRIAAWRHLVFAQVLCPALRATATSANRCALAKSAKAVRRAIPTGARATR